MARDSIIWGVLVMGCAVQALSVTSEDNPPEYMSKEERESLKEEARDMFYHAYNAYMDNAYPADELMPLSCKGRYRGSEPDRGDIDSTLGNFSLTLVDTLDTLVVLGDLEEFENAVRLVVEDVKFDTDVIVSLFETNIRMLGGLLSGHILAEYLQLRADIMPWYRGELLDLAKDLGYRFLPAFNTTTGIPFGRINLRHGMKGVPAEMCRETCTACAGSMILEMAALSRLTGESIFEEKAQKAMDALWKMRHRGTDLMGSVLNVHSGDWVRRDSGVGAGIDSYYEYCLKAYILLGDEKYLGRFNKHYQAVMKYVSQGPMLLDVHMHRPNTNSKNFMDALLAFWPGLQVLKGDIKPAVETHEMLYQVMQRHNFIPEAFTTDFQVHWGHHPLRPEFLESTYFLYRATGDHYYLGVGRKVLKSLQTYARVTCGYAAVSDVRTNKHDDTMDSFVLSETFKYLFLLFAEPNDLVLDLDEFIFTTEGHLLPLTLAAVRTNVTADLDRDIVQVDELDRTCPNSLHLFPATVRQPLRNMVEDVCPRRSLKRRLNASQFQANNLEHLKILSNMGITILTLADGRVQLLHTFSNARTTQDAEEGLLFMQEMVELSRKQSQESETRPQFVAYVRNDVTPPQEVTLLAGPAHFGPGFKDGNRVTGKVEFASPSEACSDLVEPKKLAGKVVMVARGNCMFVEKARRIQKAGAIAGIVLDTAGGSSASVSPMFAMSGDGKEPDDVTIPVVFLFNKEATELVVSHIANDGQLTVTLGDFPRNEVQLKAPGDLSVFEQLKGSLKDFLVRQVTSQNSEITSRPPVGAPTSTEVEGDTGEAIPVEYANFRALIYKDKDVVKIEKTGAAPASTRTSSSSSSQSLNNFEKTWYSMKQGFVNIIYWSQPSWFRYAEPTFLEVSIAKVQFQYKMIHKLRGLNPILPVEKLSRNRILIRWLLKELSEVQPTPTLIDGDVAKMKFANFAAKDDSADVEKSLKQGAHEKLIERIEALDRKKLILINATPKQLDHESLRPDIAALGLELKEEILSNLATKTNEALEEPLMQSLRSNFLDFKSSPLTDNEKTAETCDKIIRTVDQEQNTVLSYAHLKATIFEDKNIVKFGKTDVIPSETIPPPSLDESNFNSERAWYDIRQNLLNLMYSRPEPSIEISAEMLGLYYMVRAQRDPNYRSTTGIFQDRVAWYLKELSQVQPDPKVVEIYVFLRVKQEFEAPFDLQLVRNRFDEEIAALDMNFPNLERNFKTEDVLTEIVRATGDTGANNNSVDQDKNVAKKSNSETNQTPSKEARTSEHNKIVLSYKHLDATIFKDKSIVKFSKTDVIPTATIPPDGLDNSNFNSERNWYNQRQNLLSFMYSDPNRFLLITAEDLGLQYRTMRMLRDPNYRPATANLLDMVEWFLDELTQVQPDPNMLEIFVLRHVKERFKPPFDLGLIREHFDKEIAALDIRFFNLDKHLNSESILTEIEKIAESRSCEKPEKSENTRSAKDEDKSDAKKRR